MDWFSMLTAHIIYLISVIEAFSKFNGLANSELTTSSLSLHSALLLSGLDKFTDKETLLTSYKLHEFFSGITTYPKNSYILYYLNFLCCIFPHNPKFYLFLLVKCYIIVSWVLVIHHVLNFWKYQLRITRRNVTEYLCTI